MLPKAKRQITNITIIQARHSQSFLFMHLIIAPFQTGSKNDKLSETYIYVRDNNVFMPDQYFSVRVIERNFAFCQTNTFSWLCYCYGNSSTEGFQCFAHPCNYLSFNNLRRASDIFGSLSDFDRQHYTKLVYVSPPLTIINEQEHGK